MPHQFVKHLRALAHHFVLVRLFVLQQADDLRIATLGIVIVGTLPVDVSQAQEQDTLFHPTPCAFLGTLFVILDGLQGILLGHIHVSDGIIHLIQILLVLGVSSHGFQALDGACIASPFHGHFGALDACVEFQFVGRIASDDLAECRVGLWIIAHMLVDLSQQEVMAGTLLAPLLFLHGFLQMGQCLLEASLLEQVVAIRHATFGRQ